MSSGRFARHLEERVCSEFLGNFKPPLPPLSGDLADLKETNDREKAKKQTTNVLFTRRPVMLQRKKKPKYCAIPSHLLRCVLFVCLLLCFAMR